MSQPPFKLTGDDASTRSQPRNVVGRFTRLNAVPANPLEEVKPAVNDQQVLSGWAPGIGQGSAELSGARPAPLQPLKPLAPSFKLNG